MHSTAHVTQPQPTSRTSTPSGLCFVSSASRSAVRASERRTARRASLLGHRTLWGLPWSLQSLPCRLSDLDQHAYPPPPTGVCIACVLPVPSAFLVLPFALLRRADSRRPLSTKHILLSHLGYPFDWTDCTAAAAARSEVHHHCQRQTTTAARYPGAIPHSSVAVLPRTTSRPRPRPRPPTISA